jgi:hypothetical protein
VNTDVRFFNKPAYVYIMADNFIEPIHMFQIFFLYLSQNCSGRHLRTVFFGFLTYFGAGNNTEYFFFQI